MANKSYSSLYQIKDYMVNTVAPKYLATDEMNMSSTGIFGYITELLANMAEDGMNATSMVFKECFANAAENPESLYLMAAIQQLDDLMATPATMPFVMLVNEDDIVNGGIDSSDFSVFYIDARTTFSINSINFMLDYDVKISTKKTNNGYVHAVTYLMDHTNAVAYNTSQYIKSKVIQYNNVNYVAILVYLRQMTTVEYNETVISNDSINVLSYDYSIDTTQQLAGFDIFYTAPGSSVETQMSKKMANTSKMTTPFCFYTLPDEHTLRISFAGDDRYFSPAYNSALRVVLYTTTGTAGNFSKYTGTDINIVPRSDKYSQDNGLVLIGQVEDASSGGADKKTTEELRDDVITAQSTVNAFNTENDLQRYFKKLNKFGNDRIMFMKRRDDALIRLFNAFTMMVDSNDVVVPTNTCDIIFEKTDIDAEYAETYRYVIKAGKLYTYSSSYSGFLTTSTKKITEDLDSLEGSHVYTLPYLTILSSNPVSAGFYINSVDDSLALDTDNVNTGSFVQFMVSPLTLKRNALLGDSDYTMGIKLLATSSSTGECITEVKDDTLVTSEMVTFTNPYDNKKYINNQLIKVVMMFTDNAGTEICYKEFELYEYDTTYYYFKAVISTDDYVSTNNRVRITNSVYDLSTNKVLSEKFIPSSSLVANLYTFYKYVDGTANTSHDYTSRNIAVGYTLTNKYTSTSNPINLVVPLNSVNANLAYNHYVDANGKSQYNYRLTSVPVVKANYLKNSTRFSEFLTNFNTVYSYLSADIDKLTNNFSIDLKFYNTYGPSKNYVVGESATSLDKVNLTLKFAIKAYYATDTDTLISDIKEYILSDIRTDFDTTGNNALYISNLIRKLEVKFASKIEYIIFKGINNYDLSVQKLDPKVTSDNITTYYSSMESYVPEYVNPNYKISGTTMAPQIEITLES